MRLWKPCRHCCIPDELLQCTDSDLTLAICGCGACVQDLKSEIDVQNLDDHKKDDTFHLALNRTNTMEQLASEITESALTVQHDFLKNGPCGVSVEMHQAGYPVVKTVRGETKGKIMPGMRLMSIDEEDVSKESLQTVKYKLQSAPRPCTFTFGIDDLHARCGYHTGGKNEELKLQAVIDSLQHEARQSRAECDFVKRELQQRDEARWPSDATPRIERCSKL